MYTHSKIKQAFWKTFHEQGEIFFDYLGTKEENEKSTENTWKEFCEYLKDNSDDYIVTFLEKGGRDYEREAAIKNGLIVGKKYTVIGGYVGRNHSYYNLEEIDGDFNTCMFNKDWEEIPQGILRYDY